MWGQADGRLQVRNEPHAAAVQEGLHARQTRTRGDGLGLAPRTHGLTQQTVAFMVYEAYLSALQRFTATRI